MNHRLLSADRIAALFDAAAEGKRPLESSGGRARWLRTIDFTRPTKFTPDQENRLRRAHEAFCRTAATKLAAEHRIGIELEVVDVAQRTWHEAHGLVPRSSMSAVLDLAPLGTKVLIAVQRPLLLFCIERLLGAADDATPRERTLTEIDLMLVRRVVEVLVGCLTAIWQPMAGVSFAQTALEAHAETVGLMSSSEPTLAFTMEARIGDSISRIVLLLPHSSVQPVAAAYSKRKEGQNRHDPAAAGAVRERLGGVDVTVRAEVGSVRLPVREVLQLKPGDTVPLGLEATADLSLRADDVELYRVKAGRAGRQRAVQVVGTPADQG
jgi:flagellar motor switch protein FliM